VPGPVQVAWLTGTEDLNRELVLKLLDGNPGLPVLTVSEFPVAGARWIAYHPKRTFTENLTSIRAALQAETVRKAAMILVPRVPFQKLRTIAILLSGAKLAVYDRNLNVRPWPAQVPRFGKAWAEWHARPTSPLRRWATRLKRPREALVPLYAKLAHISGRLRRNGMPATSSFPPIPLLPGTAVIIPSRNGLALLKPCLTLLLPEAPEQIVIVDNGSDDGTAEWVTAEYPAVEVVQTAEPLSFARAINVGLRRINHERVLLLNNDMLVEPAFLRELNSAFESDANLFCATAEILFPPGLRREETGKAVLREPSSETEFPVRCELPLPGEDGTWVLYGSGGCSLFSSAKLRELGGLNESLQPAYVEDLDLGYRAWKQGWPSVFRAGARVEHRHRSTTARYWTEQQLTEMVQLNYLRFLATAISSPVLFRRLWNHAIRRLHLTGSLKVLRAAVALPLRSNVPSTGSADEEQFLSLTNGDVAVFPGRKRSCKPVIAIASAYLPYPLSHGGAVRIFNLMTQAAPEFDLVLVTFSEHWTAPAPELLAIAAEIVIVRRAGTHYRVSTKLPDTVEEFASATFAAALRQTVQKWNARAVQLEWTQMAQYAGDCVPAKTVLVEHDITYDLYGQMARDNPRDREFQEQLQRWRAFETEAWKRVDRVVTMSDKDRSETDLLSARTIPNGVDIDHYRPSDSAVAENTLLFIGSFAHLPNRTAIEWFLSEVWPLLEHQAPKLHIIAGMNPEGWSIGANTPRVSIEGFVADVRPAYRHAAVVIAPLITSAGTNIKILEAMAMGKAIVSTPAGVNGLRAEGVKLASSPQEFADAIIKLLNDAELRRTSGALARSYVERRYSWSSIAQRQTDLYRELGAI